MKNATGIRIGTAMTLMAGVAIFVLPVAAQESAAAHGKLTKVASFEHQATGIIVARNGQMFVNFPRWREDAPVSMAELKDGKPVA